MLQKLILLAITAIFFGGCGAEAPAQEGQDRVQTTLYRANETGQEQESLTMALGVPATEPMVAEDLASAAEYFVFSTTTNTISDEEGLTLLYENQCIPAFTSGDSGRAEWVTEILEGFTRDFQTDSQNLYDYALEFIESDGTEYFYSFSNYQQIGAARHDEKVVSLISLSSLYSGGSHPISAQTAYNLDIANRRILRLEDVIAEDAAGELAKLVRENVDSKFAPIDGGNGLFADYTDTIDTSMTYGNMTPYWYLNDTGLVIFFNQYELGPYAAGIIKVELPYENLEGILLDEFYPAKADGVPGDLVLRGNWSGYNRIPITIEGDGQTLLVGVEGRVHQVQLSEILWLDDTPIAQNLLFSALTLEQNDVLEITGGYTDENRSFAIEFVNGQGEHRIYYLRDGELSAEP